VGHLMENLLIYINPRKGFDREHEILARVQVDNGHRLGKLPFMVTNFSFEYNGIRALQIPDSTYCHLSCGRTSKVTAILHLFDLGLIDETFWFHDFDAYQVCHFDEDGLGLDGPDTGFTDYGWSPKWNTGSFFFKLGSRDVFKWILHIATGLGVDEEQALVAMTNSNYNKVNERIKRLNITYNLGMRKIDWNLGRAELPVKVVHFHPMRPGLLKRFEPIVGDGLMSVFRSHGIG
jgi:hypothetical protein